MCRTLGISLKSERIQIDMPTSRELEIWSNEARRKALVCEHCLAEGIEKCDENLVSHHILYKYKYPQYALKKWNAMVLCEKHHKLLHSQEGYRKD